VVHADEALFTGVAGNVLALEIGPNAKPGLGAADAVARAKADYARAARTSEALAYDRESQVLGVLPEGGAVRLAWHVTFHTELQAGIKPTVMHYFIDAHDGSILKQYNGIDTAVVEASGPGGNVKVSRTWDSNLDVTQSGSTYSMSTSALQTVNLNHGTSSGSTYTSTSLTFTDAAGNDAHGFAEQTLKMLKDWFGYDSIDGKGFLLISRVHYSTGFDNAFWDGAEMNYGDGSTYFYEMSGALDVAAHEIDHGFTSNHSALEYFSQSGGMNEAFSDIAGTTAKFFFDPAHASFDLGGDIIKSPQLGTALRYMCTPSKDGSSIDNASQYNESLDVHYSSGVMNRAFCRASKRLSGVDPDTGNASQDGVHQAGKAWFEANAHYWTSSATFVQGCQGVVDAAKALGYSKNDIAALGDAWKDVGVTCNYDGGTTCTPQCTGKSCGDDGCGHSCGSCADGETCSGGTCVGDSTATEQEPNDKSTSANSITPGTALNGTIGTSGDADWFTFQVKPGGHYTVTLSNLPIDMSMTVYRHLASGGVSKVETAASQHDQGNQVVTHTTRAGGTYLVKLFASAGVSSSSSYQLGVTTSP
jgi:pseudolysin/vibriolysin